jgi:hypothetical protein
MSVPYDRTLIMHLIDINKCNWFFLIVLILSADPRNPSGDRHQSFWAILLGTDAEQPARMIAESGAE